MRSVAERVRDRGPRFDARRGASNLVRFTAGSREAGACRQLAIRYSMSAMSWGEVELEPEVRDWYLSLDEQSQGRVRFHIDRLGELGPLLDEPHTKQLDGKLRELRFYLGAAATRITYWIAPGRRIVLLTVFVKTRQREQREIERARAAMRACIADDHTLDDD